MHQDAQEYFDRIRSIWKSFLGSHRVIPFCTPVLDRPTALVIGKNHSTFAPRDPALAEEIAARYAAGIPTDNTYLTHGHTFANGLTRACADAGITIDEGWMGTNRCAIQTDAHGIGPLQRMSEFGESQRAMDDCLRDLISTIRPVNVLLAGAYAIELFYPDRGTRLIPELECKTIRSWPDKLQTKIIPLNHPSRGPARAKIATKLLKCFVRPPVA